MYIPNPGDIALLEMETGSWYQPKEQQYLFIISNNTFHRFTGMAIACPIIPHGQPSPLHIKCEGRTKTNGMICCEHVKTMDIKTRELTFIEKVPRDILDEVRDILYGILESEE
ncbi:mRNA interferase MazF [Gracilibacillus ureilyticus]|uniref:mRNA interferase MazF n=1 Tax=Gracilibacillus ureilyticus TaxID=531814 RepID=A0A1H9USU3_9BACI|nr:type II toxin-antitoxin system PemK/MazF family toxin [Gracilibacillus ureilyticus]SES12409.1 mRNA interferase MazF [Gracilibacillus ureilyticus]